MSRKNKPKFHCKSEAQKAAIRKYYAERGKNDRDQQVAFSNKFPFWARLRMSKQRTTLVIDETKVVNKKTKRVEDGFVHREATHTEKPDYEKIYPNPDKSDPEPMYLKRPRKHPKKLFEPHNKDLDMPEHLRERYDKNNKKDK